MLTPIGNIPFVDNTTAPAAPAEMDASTAHILLHDSEDSLPSNVSAAANANELDAWLLPPARASAFARIERTWGAMALLVVLVGYVAGRK